MILELILDPLEGQESIVKIFSQSEAASSVAFEELRCCLGSCSPKIPGYFRAVKNIVKNIVKIDEHAQPDQLDLHAERTAESGRPRLVNQRGGNVGVLKRQAIFLFMFERNPGTIYGR
jgi:hypothetical protein